MPARGLRPQTPALLTVAEQGLGPAVPPAGDYRLELDVGEYAPWWACGYRQSRRTLRRQFDEGLHEGRPPKDHQCDHVDRHRDPEDRDEGHLASLVPEHSLGNDGSGPSTQQAEYEQSRF